MWTSDLLPGLSLTGQPVVYSDMTVRLRAEDARALGQELSGLFARAVQLGAQMHNDAAKSYFHMVALLPFEEPSKR